MRGNVIETVMGAVVLVVAALFLFFAYSTSQLRPVQGYEVTANFARIDGIREGSDVRISGIKVGSVLSQRLDPETYDAVLRISIDRTVKLRDDTAAQIVSAGLLGDKYISLVPGGADNFIPPGGQIRYTTPSVILENLIGQMIFSPQSGQKPPEGAAPPAPPGNQPGSPPGSQPEAAPPAPTPAPTAR